MRDEQRFSWVPPEYRRRSVLRLALGGAATAASAALLDACGTRSSPSAPPAVATAPATSGAPVTASAPARPAASGILPSPAPNVPNAYLTPPPPVQSVAAVPGKGGKVSITKASQRPPAVPHDQNQWWQELEKRLGVAVDFTLVPLPQYTEKATALIASGDLPDLLLIAPLSAPDQYKAVSRARSPI